MLVFHSKKSDAVSNKLQLSKSSLTKAVTTVTTVLFELTKEGKGDFRTLTESATNRVSNYESATKNQPSRQLRTTESATKSQQLKQPSQQLTESATKNVRVTNQERPSQQPRTSASATKESTESATKQGPFQQPKIKAKGGGGGGDVITFLLVRSSWIILIDVT